jgi:hypothetical protein
MISREAIGRMYRDAMMNAVPNRQRNGYNEADKAKVQAKTVMDYHSAQAALAQAALARALLSSTRSQSSKMANNASQRAAPKQSPSTISPSAVHELPHRD